MPAKRIKSKRFPKGYAWYIDVDLKGLPRVRKAFATEKEANDAETALRSQAMNLELNKELGVSIPSRSKLKRLLEVYLEDIKSRRHYGAIKTTLERFHGIAGAEASITGLRSVDLQNYIRVRKKAGMAPQSINREITEIKACLNAAWKYFPELETFRCPRVERLPEPEIRVQVWTDEDIKAVLKELLRPAQLRENPQQLQQRRAVAELFVVCLETGMRAGEARTLKRSQVDFKRRVIFVTSYKGNRVRTREVMMNDTVFTILQRRARENEYLFPSITDRTKPMSTYLGAFRGACKRAEINYGRGKETGVVFYDARKSFENEALDRGLSPHAVAKNQGHSVSTMAKSYLRSTEKQRREVVNTDKNFGEILETDLVKTSPTSPTGENQDETKPRKTRKTSE